MKRNKKKLQLLDPELWVQELLAFANIGVEVLLHRSERTDC
jgi:hypothetical protein